MLSIGKLVAGQEAYYERQVGDGRDDYYSERGEVPGEWRGGGARALGLEGRVSREQLTALMDGRDPRNPESATALRASNSKPEVVGLDLTFSAPKSVSVLFATADEATIAELVEAHETAVDAALAYMEDAAVRVRRGKGGHRFEETSGVVAAGYRHRMSRAEDPQLHTHVVCANLAQGSDGRWTAVHHPSIYRHAKTAGYLYESHLRAEVRDRLGLVWGPVGKGIAELRGVDGGVREHFSRRRAEMLEAAASTPGLSMDSKAGAGQVAVRTRDRKRNEIDTPAWRAEVRARAAEHGLDRDAIAELVDDGRARLERGDAVRPAVSPGRDEDLVGPHGLTEMTNAFDERELLQHVAVDAAQGARVDELRGEARGFAQRADVHQVQGPEVEWTTSDLIAHERELVAAAVGRAGEGCAIVADSARDHALTTSGLSLSAEQAAVVTAVTASGNGVDVVEARAGTGKTYTAGAIREVYEHAGLHVIGVAPSAAAARELTQGAGIAAWTIDRALIDLDASPLGSDTVVVVDEAGMAATRKTRALLAHAQTAGAKVIAIGDSGQLPSVQAGGWLRAVGDRVGHSELSDVHRQADLEERRALGHLHDGRPGAFLRWQLGEELLHLHTSPEGSALEDALGRWRVDCDELGPKDAVLLARDNDARETLNTLARAHMRAAGGLDDDELTYGPVALSAGDRVIARRNDRTLDVDNGTRATVRAIAPNAITIETDAGTVRELPGAYVAEHVEHAYCLTGHGAQGATIQRPTVYARPHDLTAGWSYTALSRGREHTHLHVETLAPEREEGPDAQPALETRRLLERLRLRMLVRDDEDLAIDRLPPGLPAAGRVDDRELVESGTLDGVPVQEQPAARQEAAAAAGDPVALGPLRALQEQRETLIAQRSGLELQRLEELERIEQRHQLVDAQREQMQDRLSGLPEPEQRRLRAPVDPFAGERANLTSAIDATGQELTALEQRHEQLRTGGPDLGPIRQERDGIDHRISELEQEIREQLDELADRETRRRPEWARELLGDRPDAARAASVWDEAARDVARYRLEHDVADDTPGLGPEPGDDHGRHAHQHASRAIDRGLQRLGRQTPDLPDLGRDR